jgi:hypothetical protein
MSSLPAISPHLRIKPKLLKILSQSQPIPQAILLLQPLELATHALELFSCGLDFICDVVADFFSQRGMVRLVVRFRLVQQAAVFLGAVHDDFDLGGGVGVVRAGVFGAHGVDVGGQGDEDATSVGRQEEFCRAGGAAGHLADSDRGAPSVEEGGG